MKRMVFKYKVWDDFCKKLYKLGLISIPAKDVCVNSKRYITLKHDVETNVPKAFELACIEQKYGHRGSYYVQAYLMDDKKNIDLLLQMQKMGHEISYHYDVMDSNKGDLENATLEFEQNRKKFAENGFGISTVCQHGNPVVERIGYTSNRDFFRSAKVQELYPNIADIMVDYKMKYDTEYAYYSDAGRCFKFIYDPINNDRENSEIENVSFANLDEVLLDIKTRQNVIVSTHPHRWTKTSFEYIIKNCIFKVIKSTAKVVLHIPGMKKIMSRYYYLAKKI